MATQFTASEHLNDPGHLSDEYLQNSIRNFYLGKSTCFRLELVWIRPIDPECCCASWSTVPTQLLRILCICAHLFVSLCCSLKCAIKSQVPVLQKSGTNCHWVISQREICARYRSRDSMATNMAEVLKLAARPTPYDNDERTWLEFRFNLENCLTLVNERYVQLQQDAESQPVTLYQGHQDAQDKQRMQYLLTPR